MSKKLRKFLLAEVERMYAEAAELSAPFLDAFNSSGDSTEIDENFRAVEVFEDILWVAFSLPKPYRNVMLRRIAVLFEDSPKYKEKWRP